MKKVSYGSRVVFALSTWAGWVPRVHDLSTCREHKIVTDVGTRNLRLVDSHLKTSIGVAPFGWPFCLSFAPTVHGITQHHRHTGGSLGLFCIEPSGQHRNVVAREIRSVAKHYL